MTKAYMTISVGSKKLGTISINLHTETVPQTCKNFITLIKRPQNRGYVGSTFHRVIKGFMIQGGDFTNHDGTGGESIYGNSFPDENFIHRHDGRGVISMANSGKDTNGSQFFITFKKTSHLDGKHVVFGSVEQDDDNSWSVLDYLEKIKTDSKDRPLIPVVISACGIKDDEEEQLERKKDNTVKQNDDAVAADDDEIDLDDSDQEETPEDTITPHNDSENDPPITTEPPPIAPQKKLTPLQQRLLNLKMKVNQSKRLNRKEVMAEGERLGTSDGMERHRQKLLQDDKKRRQQEWIDCHKKVMAGDLATAKKMTMPAGDAVRKEAKKTAKAKSNRFGVDDYYNPEGQHRNYERNLKSLPRGEAAMASSSNGETYDPVNAGLDGDEGVVDVRDGVKRLSRELKRRGEKAKEKRNRLEFEGLDVSYVNQRNKRFNEKINRNYDKYTAEIRQNLERGTAL